MELPTNGLEKLIEKKNLYRHIYKQNILSNYHFEEKFDGLLLEEWIKSNNYGTIDKIGMENWLWIVPEDKLYEIQVILCKKGLLIGVDTIEDKSRLYAQISKSNIASRRKI